MKHLSRIVLILFLLPLLSISCDMDGAETIVIDTIGGGVPESYSRVSFSLASASRSMKTADTTAPSQVLYLDLMKGSFQSVEASLLDIDTTGNEIALDLPKDGLYIIGFLGRDNETSLVASSARDSRSIAGAVSMLGNLNIVSFGLDTLPVSGVASDQIDLGQVEQTEDQFSSAISQGQATLDLGYSGEELARFGVYDETLRKFYNVDINANGTIDWEEDFHWDFRFVYSIREDNSTIPLDYSYETLQTIPSAMEIDELSYIVDLNFLGELDPEIAIPANETEIPSLSFPGVTVHDSTGVIEALTGTTFEFNPGQFQSQFRNLQEIRSPDVPFSADFILTIQGIDWFFDNISFVTPDNSYENFLHPFYRFSVDSNGFITQLEWEIRIAENNNFVPISIEQFRQLWNSNGELAFEYSDTAEETVHYQFPGSLNEKTSGVEDLSSLQIHSSDLKEIKLFFEDRGKTVYEFVFNTSEWY